MSAHRETDLDYSDNDATVKLPRPTQDTVPEVSHDLEDFDPESTLVRDDWESTVIRRVAPHVAAVQGEIEDLDATVADERFGWESAVIRRLAVEMQKNGI